MTQINITVNQIELEFLIRKLKLDIHSSISLAIQTKHWLLQEENVQDAKEENQILKNKLLRKKLENSSLIKRKLVAETRISEYHADNLGVIGSNPSKKAKEAMGHYVNKTTPVDENSIVCSDCPIQNQFQITFQHKGI